MKILNQKQKQILQTDKDKHDRDKIAHMATNGYASVIIHDKKVSYVKTEAIEDEQVVFVEVEGLL